MDHSAVLSEEGTPLSWSEFVAGLFEKAAPYLAVRGDLDHTRVSHSYALTLMSLEGGDSRIVEPAVIFHDVGWSVLKPEAISAAFGVMARGEEAERLNRIHEIQGALIAQEILRSFDYDRALTEKITAIIIRHDSGKKTDSREESLVKDADKLWRFSSAGFWHEKERQHLAATTLLDFLEQRYKGWFFSSAAVKLADKELVSRRQEIAS